MRYSAAGLALSVGTSLAAMEPQVNFANDEVQAALAARGENAGDGRGVQVTSAQPAQPAGTEVPEGLAEPEATEVAPCGGQEPENPVAPAGNGEEPPVEPTQAPTAEPT